MSILVSILLFYTVTEHSVMVSARGCPGSTCITPVWLERCKLIAPQCSLVCNNTCMHAAVSPADDSANVQLLQAGPRSGISKSAVDVHPSAPAPLQAGNKHVLQEFADCFPDELPAGLPPARNAGHTTPVQPGTGAVCRPLFRNSPAELAEIKRQLADYLAKDLLEATKGARGLHRKLRSMCCPPALLGPYVTVRKLPSLHCSDRKLRFISCAPALLGPS